MSFVPGSESRDLWLVIGGTAALIGSLHAWSRREDGSPGRIVSRCADGSVIGAWGFGVRRRPARGRRLHFEWWAGRGWPGADAAPRTREDLEPGDLSFVRIREGGPDETPWVVEGLGPGPVPFRIQWAFDSPDPALTAYRLLEARIARPPEDGGGRVIALGDREFDALWRSDERGGGPVPESARLLRA